MKKYTFLIILHLLFACNTYSQALRLPSSTNFECSAGRKIGVTNIDINWRAPGVKGREGKIWGTNIAYFGTQVLGFGSDVESPWRAGADEATTISFSTDVIVQGKPLQAGTYAIFMLLSNDSTTIIFNKNTKEWGTYFYDQSLDVLRVKVTQKKNQPSMQERLIYQFSNQTANSVDISLDWEYWSIPFSVQVDLTATTLAHIKSELSGDLGFDPPSLQYGAKWCEENSVNLTQALSWINTAMAPNLGGNTNFANLMVKAGLLSKLNKKVEADAITKDALKMATITELHQYGRSLLNQNKVQEALVIFEKNYKDNQGKWPTAAGLMRGYSAAGNIPEALKYARLALSLAPDAQNKRFIEGAIKTLEEGKKL
jgi:hypothetical protein